jgi:uncharacterized protein with PQ loop repeat
MKKSLHVTIKCLLILDGFFAGIPQIVRILEHRSSSDVSILSWSWMAIIACLWIYQGIRENSPVLLWSSVIWGLNNASVAVIAAVFRG